MLFFAPGILLFATLCIEGSMAKPVQRKVTAEANPAGAAANNTSEQPPAPDPVEEASIESFPASDPPAFNLGEEGKQRPEQAETSSEQPSEDAGR